MITDADISRAEALGRLAARGNANVDTCPYEADGDDDQRILAVRFVRAYYSAGGDTSSIDYGDGTDAGKGSCGHPYFRERGKR